MKVIDKTPLYKDGQLSFGNRMKALLQFGQGWIHEVEEQRAVVSVLERTIDKSFTAIRNLVLPGLDAEIPVILVGPSGIYVINVLSAAGTFRAKGDQWGSISGSAFKEEKPNLLVRTDRLSQVVQKYLQAHGRTNVLGVEAVLLCSNPSTHIDSQRPIVRVVMRDALERFAVSISQGRVNLAPADVFDIISRLTSPKGTAESNPAGEAGAEDNALPEQQEQDPFAAYAPWGPPAAPAQENAEAAPPPPQFTQPSSFISMEVNPLQVLSAQPRSRVAVRKSRKNLSVLQWLFLAAMFFLWCLIMGGFGYYIWSTGLLP